MIDYPMYLIGVELLAKASAIAQRRKRPSAKEIDY
jgi:hypothetical protein